MKLFNWWESKEVHLAESEVWKNDQSISNGFTLSYEDDEILR